MSEQKNLAAASGVSRRTIMKGAAWSVPVVLATAASPARAASEPDGPVVIVASDVQVATLGGTITVCGDNVSVEPDVVCVISTAEQPTVQVMVTVLVGEAGELIEQARIIAQQMVELKKNSSTGEFEGISTIRNKATWTNTSATNKASVLFFVVSWVADAIGGLSAAAADTGFQPLGQTVYTQQVELTEAPVSPATSYTISDLSYAWVGSSSDGYHLAGSFTLNDADTPCKLHVEEGSVVSFTLPTNFGDFLWSVAVGANGRVSIADDPLSGSSPSFSPRPAVATLVVSLGDWSKNLRVTYP